MLEPTHMNDRRAKTPMSDEHLAEFKKIGDAISGCKISIREEVGKAEKGYQILSAGIKEVDQKVDRTERKVEWAMRNGDERLDRHGEMLAEQAEEIEKLKVSERKLKEGLDSVIKSVNQTNHVALTTNTVVSSLQMTQSDGFTAMSRQFSTVGDSINQLRDDLKGNSSNKKWYQKLPLPAYGVITVAICGVLIYWLTGDDTIVNLFKRGV